MGDVVLLDRVIAALAKTDRLVRADSEVDGGQDVHPLTTTTPSMPQYLDYTAERRLIAVPYIPTVTLHIPHSTFHASSTASSLTLFARHGFHSLLRPSLDPSS